MRFKDFTTEREIAEHMEKTLDDKTLSKNFLYAVLQTIVDETCQPLVDASNQDPNFDKIKIANPVIMLSYCLLQKAGLVYLPEEAELGERPKLTELGEKVNNLLNKEGVYNKK